jgi:hypothetical protein
MTLEKAIRVAVDAHAGQLEKAGAPYIFHPLRGMTAVESPSLDAKFGLASGERRFASSPTGTTRTARRTSTVSRRIPSLGP